MYDKKIAVIGGDKRQKYLTDKFTEMGYKAVIFGAKEAVYEIFLLSDI